MPDTVYEIAQAEHADAVRAYNTHTEMMGSHSDDCPVCESLAGHVARTRQQAELLKPPDADAAEGSLF